MCGIVGYVGEARSLEVLLGGLRRLEYRGYDSAGVAVLDADGTVTEAGYAELGPGRVQIEFKRLDEAVFADDEDDADDDDIDVDDEDGEGEDK